MKSFTDVMDSFRTDLGLALDRVMFDGTKIGRVRIDGTIYEVRWGTTVDKRNYAVDCEVSLVSTLDRLVQYTDYHARIGRPMSAIVRICLLFGSKRLEVWRMGGEFPETVEELFSGAAEATAGLARQAVPTGMQL